MTIYIRLDKPLLNAIPVYVTDLSGRIIHHLVFPEEQDVFEYSISLTPGMYLLQWVLDEQSHAQKLVISSGY